MAKQKQISKNDVTGDRGIAFIHRVVSDMAHIWTPNGLEAGIDGFIELRDDTTSRVGARILQVQSKAGESHFRSESKSEFTYYCDESDIDYWMQANTPVLLIVSRPERNEGYWVHIQGYFEDVEKRKSKKIIFQKAAQRFIVDARDAIERLATPATAAYHAKIANESETLWSNLCPLTKHPDRIFRAKTRLKSPRSVIERLSKATDLRGREWLLHGGYLYSFDDLSFDCYRDLHSARVPENLAASRHFKQRRFQCAIHETVKRLKTKHDAFTVCATQLIRIVQPDQKREVGRSEIAFRQFDAGLGSNQQQGFHSLVVGNLADVEQRLDHVGRRRTIVSVEDTDQSL